MKKINFYSFKRKKLAVKVKRFFGMTPPKVVLTDIQKKALRVLREMTKNPESVLQADPLLQIGNVYYKDYYIEITPTYVVVRGLGLNLHCYFDFETGNKAYDFFLLKNSERKAETRKKHDRNEIEIMDSFIQNITNIPKQ